MRLKYLMVSVLMICLLIQTVAAQVKVTNEDGDKIVLMPDGTWQYLDKEKQATVSSDVKAKQQSGKTEAKKNLTKAQKKELKAQQKNEKRKADIQKKLAKKQTLEDKKTVTAEGKKPAKKDKTAEAKKDKTAEAKKDKTAEAKKDKTAEAKKDKTAEAKKDKTAKSKNNKSEKDKSKTAKVTNKKPSKKGNVAKTGNAQKPTKKQVKLAKEQFKAFKTSNIVIPKLDCEYAMNEVDAFTGKKKVALAESFFFGYTHPQLEKYLRGEDYLTCRAALSQIGSMKVLNLKFIVDSPTAQEDYGSILEGSRLIMTLLDGSTITMISVEQDGGKIDRVKKQTVYKSYFILDSKQEKQLAKSEINQVRMVWSQGFEDYNINEVDFLMKQLQCLKQAE